MFLLLFLLSLVVFLGLKRFFFCNCCCCSSFSSPSSSSPSPFYYLLLLLLFLHYFQIRSTLDNIGELIHQEVIKHFTDLVMHRSFLIDRLKKVIY